MTRLRTDIDDGPGERDRSDVGRIRGAQGAATLPIRYDGAWIPPLDNPLMHRLRSAGALGDEDCVRLAEALSPARTAAVHADIVEAADDPCAVTVLLSGWACRYRQFNDGRRQIISLLLPGDCCGLQSFRQRHAHTAVSALTPITLAQIPGPALADLTAHSPTLSAAFARERRTASAIQHEWTVSLGRRAGVERLAHLLCEVYARLDAVALTDGASCPMPLTQADLADALGQTPVHINRMLQELRSAGLIDLRRKRLDILDVDGLADLALFDRGYLSCRGPEVRHASKNATFP